MINMNKTIIIPIALIIVANSTQSVIIRHHKTVDELDDKIRVYYNSPCKQIEAITPPELGIRYARFASTMCTKHYDNEWMATVKNLKDCLHEREKRDVISTAKTITAATNLLRSFFSNSEERLAKYKTNNYNITNHVAIKFMRDIIHSTINNDNSNSIVDSRTTLNSEVAMTYVPEHTIGDYMLHQGIAVKSYLLKRIVNSCETFKNLDTFAMAELIEDDALFAYAQNATKITKVIVDERASFFEICFEARIVIDREEEIDGEVITATDNELSMLVVVISIIALIVVVALCVGTYYGIKILRTKRGPGGQTQVWGDIYSG